MTAKSFLAAAGLVVALLMAGCDRVARYVADTASSAAADSAEVTLVRDLGTAGRCYHDHIDVHGTGPANWEAFRQFAAERATDPGVLDRLQAAGYQFVWNVDLKSGVSLSDTVLAQSATQGPRLMLDGSLANVPPDVLERARQRPQSRSATATTSSPTAAAQPALPPPSNPMEQAVYNYLMTCEEWFRALAQIQDVPSAQAAKRTIRELDDRFDRVGSALAAQGMQVDFLATPAKYEKAVADLPFRQMREDARLGALPDAAAINQLFLADEEQLGPVGPRRTWLRIQEAFNSRSAPPVGAVATRQPESGAPQPPTRHDVLPPGFHGPGSRYPESRGPAVPADHAVAAADTPGIAPEAASSADTPSETAEENAPPAEMRTWSDASGRFETRAALLSHDANSVRLEKEDGTEVTIPVARLSKVDRDYLRELARAERAAAFRPGESVEVFWGSRWFPASVIEVKGKQTFIRYDGYSDNWNEWVGPERIRKRR